MHTRPIPRFAACLLCTAAVLATACTGPAATAAAKSLVVEAGDQDRVCAPVMVKAPDGPVPSWLSADGKQVPCQVVDGHLCFIVDELAAGKSRTFTLVSGKGDKPADAVTLKETDKTVAIAIAGKPLTVYRFTNPKPAGHQLRRPYFWPVYGPDQTPMTRPYPLTDEPIPDNVAKDHPHHTSIYVAHGNVNGVDNWSISGKAGWIVHREFEKVESGPVVGWFRERLDWTTRDKKPVMAETRTVRIWNLPPDHRMLDMDLAFEAKYGEVEFGDTKEGGLCATRMRPEFRHDGKGGAKGRLVNDQGQTGGDAWGKKAAWVDANGPVDGKRLGYAIFDHPENLRHPTTWHARTYGLLTANPFGLSHFTRGKENGDYTLGEGKTLRQRYRIYFHRGDEKAANVAERWGDFGKPPRATWK